jgi:UDP-glucose:(heptosyl)LPS alpha-1,3-glucosyltransferase
VNLAICHPVVIPARGGCETYIADLARRLCADGHEVHLYASRWDAACLPGSLHLHPVADKAWPRSLRPWRFSRACAAATRGAGHDLTFGFDKVAGLDVLYPAGGLHVASFDHGLLKFRHPWLRGAAWAVRRLDLAHLSFCAFERRQYLREPRPFLIANSGLVRRHFHAYLGVRPMEVPVLHCAIDPDRFAATDRPARRVATRQAWGVEPTDTVALFVAMNYRLKGLGPLLRAVARLPDRSRFRLAVVGHPDAAAYQRQARRLRITEVVRFLGFSADPRNAYFAADLLVHPTFYDPCSLVVTEAQACGLPVITTVNNGAAELLDPPNDGLVINDPHDRDELAAALGHFLDPARRQAASRAAFRAAQLWTWEQHYRRLLELLSEAARRKRAA